MKPMTFKRSRFKLKKFLDALHKFSVENLGNGDPLPVVCGETVHHDPVDLAEALADEIVTDRGLELTPLLADALRGVGCGEGPLTHLIRVCTLADWTLWNILGLNDHPSN